MKYPLPFASLLTVGTALAFLTGAAPASAVDPDPAVKKTFDKLLAAIKNNDRDAFVSEGTDAVKEGTTKEIMEALSKQLGGRLKKGYVSAYLCELKQAGHQVHLWKLTFKDGADDMVIRLALKDGKVGGFFMQ
jgi:hypothetical protein